MLLGELPSPSLCVYTHTSKQGLYLAPERCSASLGKPTRLQPPAHGALSSPAEKVAFLPAEGQPRPASPAPKGGYIFNRRPLRTFTALRSLMLVSPSSSSSGAWEGQGQDTSLSRQGRQVSPPSCGVWGGQLRCGARAAD